MQKINNKLAVHGFDWDWDKMEEINESVHEYESDNFGVIDKNSKFNRTGKKLDDWIIVDCRTLLDDWVNDEDEYKELIDFGCMFLENNFKVVCCCSAGQSRSSTIAIGILVQHFKMNFYDAMELVREKNSVYNAAPQHLSSIKHIYGVTLP